MESALLVNVILASFVPVGESEENAVNWHEQEFPYTAESEDKE